MSHAFSNIVSISFSVLPSNKLSFCSIQSFLMLIRMLIVILVMLWLLMVSTELMFQVSDTSSRAAPANFSDYPCGSWLVLFGRLVPYRHRISSYCYCQRLSTL